MENKEFKILSIDGGGIRGAFAAHFLKRIKDEFKIEFHEEFDMIIGTSTGSIIAAGMAVGYPIDKIVDLYRNEGKYIFARQYSSLFNLENSKTIFSNWKNWFKSKYNLNYLKGLLEREFEEKTLSNTKTKLLIPATDISNGNVFVFKSNYDTSFVRDKDVLISDAVLASCSAPTYFNPRLVKNYLLTDGGLWANNPSLVGLTEAMGRRFRIPKDNIKILSIGSGQGTRYYNIEDSTKEWGLGRWGRGLIESILNLQSINVDNIVSFILDGDMAYYRVNFKADELMKLDNIDVVGNLVSKADEKFTYEADRIKTFLKKES